MFAAACWLTPGFVEGVPLLQTGVALSVRHTTESSDNWKEQLNNLDEQKSFSVAFDISNVLKSQI